MSELYPRVPSCGSPPATMNEYGSVSKSDERREARPPTSNERRVLAGRCEVGTIDTNRDTLSDQLGLRLPTGWVAYGWAKVPIPEERGPEGACVSRV